MAKRTDIFYAYPSEPGLDETIKSAISTLKADPLIKQANLRFKPWPNISITGRRLITQITQSIDRTDVFASDLTYPNLNVAFELGYAVGSLKRVWISMNTTVEGRTKEFQRLYGGIVAPALQDGASSVQAYNEGAVPSCLWDWGADPYHVWIDWQFRSDVYEPGYDYKQAYEAADSNWDNSGTPVHFGTGSIVEAYLGELDTLDFSWYGKTYMTCSGDERWSADYMYLNRARIELQYGANSNAPRSVAAHELGHSAGAGHSTVNDVIMGQRDRDEIFLVKTDDICAVNSRYNDPSHPMPQGCHAH